MFAEIFLVLQIFNTLVLILKAHQELGADKS
jgi:hypothetical protein